MYQIKISTEVRYEEWIAALERYLKPRLKKVGGIMAVFSEHGRVSLSVAGENTCRQALNELTKAAVIEVFTTVVKMRYIAERLRRNNLNDKTYRLLLHTLVAFDRECEYDILGAAFTLGGEINLDGWYNFRIGELKKRWDEISALTSENSLYLNNDSNLNELLRFLISAVNPKIMRLEIAETPDGFTMHGEPEKGVLDMRGLNNEQLLLYLIDLAPIELVIRGNITDRNLDTRLRELFDAKGI